MRDNAAASSEAAASIFWWCLLRADGVETFTGTFAIDGARRCAADADAANQGFTDLDRQAAGQKACHTVARIGKCMIVPLASMRPIQIIVRPVLV